MVDNDGYTVERAIHGPDEPYNDITRWDGPTRPPSSAPTATGGRRRPWCAPQASYGRPSSTLPGTPRGLSVIQAMVPRDDVPELLDTLTRALGHAAPTMPTSS